MSRFHQGLSVMLCGAALALSAAESAPREGTFEAPVGGTTYLQLSSTALTGRPTAVIRVDDPNREYDVLRIIVEPGAPGAGTRLKVRNGYSAGVLFAMNAACLEEVEPEPARPGRTPHLMVGVRSGLEVSVTLPAPVNSVLFCDFTLQPL